MQRDKKANSSQEPSNNRFMQIGKKSQHSRSAVCPETKVLKSIKKDYKRGGGGGNEREKKEGKKQTWWWGGIEEREEGEEGKEGRRETNQYIEKYLFLPRN